MPKRILIVAAGTQQAGVIAKAREQGYFTVAVDGNPKAPGFACADVAETLDILNPAELVRVGREQAVDAVYAATETAVEAAAQASLELDLPGLSTEVAFRVRNKLAMREALRAQGVPGPSFRGAQSVEEAEAAAQEIGLPVVVKPVDACGSRGVQRVDYIEDVSLAFVQALKHSRSKAVLLEAFMAGEEYNVYGLVFEGVYRPAGIAGKERSAPPYHYNTGIQMPAVVDAGTRDALVEAAETALRAIGFESGTALVEAIVTSEGPRIVEISGRSAAGRVATDLIPFAFGLDYVADSLRVALGEAPRERQQYERGCALYWVPSHSGVVSRIEGLNGARDMPGVREVSIAVQPGDVLGHVVDCATRDRIGYVLATGETAEEAVRNAKAARDAVHVITRPTYEGG
jgi:biotin carboxylase